MEFYRKKRFFFSCVKLGLISADKLKNRKAFTLIELLVVLTISMLLSSVLILYSHGNRQQIALYSEKARLSQAIFNAKSLSLAFYKPVSNSYCGYGVHIDYVAQTYSIFRYSKAGITDCSKITNINTASEEVINTVSADINVVLAHPGSGAWLDDVLFVPPYPVTFVNSNGSFVTNGYAGVTIRTLDNSLSDSVSVNSAGLINF